MSPSRERLEIFGGRVYDPANARCGEIESVWIEGGRIVDPPADGQATRRLDATGRVVFPGGIDLHCHIAGPAANRARALLAGRQAASPSLDPHLELPEIAPTASRTARLYSRLGYTCAIDAAISPAASRAAWEELERCRGLGSGFLLLLANNENLLDLLDRGEEELARALVSTALARTGAFGVKAVNAGGVSHWRSHARDQEGLEAPIGSRRLCPRDVLQFLARTVETLALPHPLHIHVARLGLPGNIEETLATSRLLGGIPHHLAHVAFNVYEAGDGPGGIASGAARFIEHLEASPELSADVGQLWFGETVTLSADQPVAHRLHRASGRPYATLDLELEGGAALLPVEYRRGSRVNALQWAIGMELLLLNPDPWRLAFSTDHPNGASFVAYPTLLAQLMSRELRREVIESLPSGALEGSVLPGLEREYTLEEIAIITRAGPARILGLPSKGHLGTGADADVVVYDDTDDHEERFRSPRDVISGGEFIVRNGELVEAPPPGERLRVEPAAPPEGLRELTRRASVTASQVGPQPRKLAGSRILTRD